MELIEKIPISKIAFLDSLSFTDFKPYCKQSIKNEEERRKHFNIVKEYCRTNLKTRGETKRIYSYTLATPLEVGGRLYSGLSCQGLSSKVRGFLFGDTTTDIDMKNAHPCILKYLCNLNNIKCPNLTDYIQNRDKYLIEYGAEYKTEFLKCINDDKPNKKMKDAFCKDFDKECKRIQRELCGKADYKHIIDTIPDTRNYNWYGSGINRIMCVYENKILQEIIHIINKNNIEIAVLMFDGLMVYGNHYENNTLLKEIEEHIESVFNGLNMKMSYKPHDTTSITMPLDFTIEPKQIINPLSFEIVTEEFEKHHCKIITRDIFIRHLNNENIMMKRQSIKNAYEHLVYKKPNKDGLLIDTGFINDWFVYPKMRVYDDIGVYPNPKLCPANHFNMWRPFEMELVTEYQNKKTELNFILNHIKILCNNDEVVYDYFIKWIAQMVQYPEVKTNCPTFISKEGAGKGSLMRLFEKMLGSSKVFETTNPSRDVWGDFNGRMANTFLINLNELSKKETMESDGRIKGLITDPKITINNKGFNQYEIPSYHRFIISTNNEEPINTTKDDRRKFIIRCSDELIGNKDYFKKFYEYLDDINVIKTCYEYFKSVPDVDVFNKLPVPITEHHESLMEYSISPIEQWLRDFTFQKQNCGNQEYTMVQILEKFIDWCNDNHIKYEVNSLQLSVRMNRLNINGIEKHKGGKGKRTTIFNFSLMKEHFGL